MFLVYPQSLVHTLNIFRCTEELYLCNYNQNHDEGLKIWRYKALLKKIKNVWLLSLQTILGREILYKEGKIVICYVMVVPASQSLSIIPSQLRTILYWMTQAKSTR
jgi:hypothetical protein